MIMDGGFRYQEPQINADERRLIVLDYPPSPKYEQPQSSDSKLPALRYGNAPRRSTRMTRIKQIFTDPCKSAPSAKSAFYRRTDPRTKSTDGKVSAFICVHPRFFYDVTFLTGWTGYDFNFMNHTLKANIMVYD